MGGRQRRQTRTVDGEGQRMNGEHHGRLRRRSRFCRRHGKDMCGIRGVRGRSPERGLECGGYLGARERGRQRDGVDAAQVGLGILAQAAADVLRGHVDEVRRRGGQGVSGDVGELGAGEGAGELDGGRGGGGVVLHVLAVGGEVEG